jgi:(1->4)-alpha-D-glucan 1-alpha-D-glucosylmutase
METELTDAARGDLAARISAYMTKALREAKQHTSWINVNAPYERAIEEFINRLLQPATGASFLADMQRFLGRILAPGMYNSLSQVVLKATAPGVPDFYQGTEMWDLSLVDPDNRRPVDFAQRRALLAEMAGAVNDEAHLPALFADRLRHPADGAPKLLVTARVLAHRRRNRDLYDRGSYVPLHAHGARGRHIVAFARTLDSVTSITAAGRLFVALDAASAPPIGRSTWGDTHILLPAELPPGPYRDALTGRVVTAVRDAETGQYRLPVADVFAGLPVAALALTP